MAMMSGMKLHNPTLVCKVSLEGRCELLQRVAHVMFIPTMSSNLGLCRGFAASICTGFAFHFLSAFKKSRQDSLPNGNSNVSSTHPKKAFAMQRFAVANPSRNYTPPIRKTNSRCLWLGPKDKAGAV